MKKRRMFPELQVRWLIRRDMDQVLDIERRSYPQPWSEEDFLVHLRERNCIGCVAEHEVGASIHGFMLYELHKSTLKLLNLAVAPESRRSGVGRAMVERLTEKLKPQRRRQVVTEISERNLDAQLFFQACGFRCERVLKNHFEGGASAYQFAYRLLDAESEPVFGGRNRLTEYDEA